MEARMAWTGLSTAEAAARLQQYGPNRAAPRRTTVWERIRPLLADPLLLLLVVAALLYFLLGQAREGALMLGAIVVVSSVSYFQERRSARALKALQSLVEPRVAVVRDGRETALPALQLVPGDLIRLSEGARVPADAQVLSANDLSVNESMLTGEALPVPKSADGSALLQGTLITSGACMARVTATGANTRLGRLGALVDSTPQPRSALQAATAPLVRALSGIGLGAFALVFTLNYIWTGTFIASLLSGLTLAMAAIPEEIPVAFTTFMALGAARLARKGVLCRNPQAVENLGAVNVICLDKTGTLTENRMVLRYVYDAATGTLCDLESGATPPLRPVYLAALASETDPFDEMEKAIWTACRRLAEPGALHRPIVHEYPLAGTPPMMTHVYEDGGSFLAAAKGAPEKILEVCHIDGAEAAAILKQVRLLATQGFRLIGVASAGNVQRWLPAQEDYPFRFEGLVALYDPPRREAADFIRQLRAAGIRPMLLTGDYPETARHIAAAVGIPIAGPQYTGTDVLAATDEALDQMTRETGLFARVEPEAKRRVIASLKRQGAYVAMTGDGVNDAPAIRLANVGIAMGHRGTEFSRQAADLVLTDDNLSRILETLREGRKILRNLKKVTSYILALHIPIFLVAVVPLLLRWPVPNILTPAHVIFLELIMGPTCSLFYEGEAAAPDSMQRPPILLRHGILTRREWRWSLVQGLSIGATLLWLYSFTVHREGPAVTRTVVFLGLLAANLLLTFANRSLTQPLWHSWQRPNAYRLPVAVISLSFLALLLLLPATRAVFSLAPISWQNAAWMAAAAIASVLWLEPLKGYFLARTATVDK